MNLSIKMSGKYLLYVFLFSFTSVLSNCYASKLSKTDSLLTVLKSTKEDTGKVNILNNLGKLLIKTSENDKAMTYLQQSKKLAEKINFKKGLAGAYQNI